MSANGGLFGVNEGLFWVIGTFFGCFCERGYHRCARSERVVENGVKGEFVVLMCFSVRTGLHIQ